MDQELPPQGFPLSDGARAAVADLAVEGDEVGPRLRIGIADPAEPGVPDLGEAEATSL
jgi:hypothetical protein